MSRPTATLHKGRLFHYARLAVFSALASLLAIYLPLVLRQSSSVGILSVQAAAVAVPPGFQLISSGTGVAVYRKTFSGRRPDYVTVVDLGRGTIRNLTGTITGAPNMSLVSRKLLGPSSRSANFWTDAVAQNTTSRKAKVVVNGTFFSTNAYPSGIAFGLKANSRIISFGYGTNEFPGLVRVLPFDSGRAAASIQPYAQSVFIGGSPDVVGGLDPTANKSPSGHLARTFVGVRGGSTVMIFSSSAATQPGAASVLTGFGAGSIMMLDGGGSTGLVLDGNAKITPVRTLPHAIAVYAGK
jgi:hypothetical protein